MEIDAHLCRCYRSIYLISGKGECKNNVYKCQHSKLHTILIYDEIQPDQVITHLQIKLLVYVFLRSDQQENKQVKHYKCL